MSGLAGGEREMRSNVSVESYQRNILKIFAGN